MYLRKNAKAAKDGSKIEHYQIAHNHRDPGTKKSKCTIVCGVGRADNPEVRERLVGLCIAIAQEYKLKIYDPVDAEFETKASQIKEIIPLEEIRRNATEKLALDSSKLRDGMVQLCQSIAKVFNLTVHDHSKSSTDYQQQITNNQYKYIDIPIDRLRRAAHNINDVMGYNPGIDQDSNWSSKDISYALAYAFKSIEPCDALNDDTLNVLVELGLLSKENLVDFRNKCSNMKDVSEHTNIDSTEGTSILTRNSCSEPPLILTKTYLLSQSLN